MPRTSLAAPFASRGMNAADVRPPLANPGEFDAASSNNPPASLRRIGVVGLGLIGGSFAKAYSDAGLQVFGADIDERSLAAATAEGSIVSALNDETVGECDLILIALYPEATVGWLRDMAPKVSKDALVIDCGGVKRSICPDCFALAEQHGFTFLGGHPMAGTHRSGFRAARSDLYAGSPMVLVPPPIYDPSVIARAQEALSVVGFGSFSVTTPEMHDRLIAYTSQLAHIVSSAFVKSPTSQKHRGFSAGSYKDLTRVAEMNAPMWTELFLDNADNLVEELDSVVEQLRRYREALALHDEETLKTLIEEGSAAKLKADGRFADAEVIM
ncbi:prephenate dehydrogenase [Slackia sp.]|uniref:prephenate dehydrogenase n=1 Tax=Slackia sp. TaxID=2049041 RepID=UPI002604132B|nr:prephenate dehydrogenase [Slackia sp.]MEE0519612.1 prephenate dehydrogenase [Slackia sp.]